MNTATEHFAPEELMAWLDGELQSVEAQAVAAHLDECLECGRAVDEFRRTALAIAQWTVPESSSDRDGAILEAAKNAGSERAGSTRSAKFGVSTSHGMRWALGGGAVFAVVLIAGYFASTPRRSMHVLTYLDTGAEPAPTADTGALALKAMPAQPAEGIVAGGGDKPVDAPAAQAARAARSMSRAGVINGLVSGARADKSSPAAPFPMIARTVSLTILAKDFAASRAALDGILTRHGGYSATLTVNTPATGQGSFQASLRIPATEVSATLADLKALGRVLTESQSGEEVTQQHADLVARLANSREEEERLRAILAQRTGKIEDVLEVEEEIARVRGEIEQMEGEQKALEHRVDFVTVDLNLTQEYREQLGQAGVAPSAGTRLHNSFVAGMRNAGDTVLGFVLFLEEDGPTIVIWLAILGAPVLFLWRRYRRIQRGL